MIRYVFIIHNPDTNVVCSDELQQEKQKKKKKKKDKDREKSEGCVL